MLILLLAVLLQPPVEAIVATMDPSAMEAPLPCAVAAQVLPDMLYAHGVGYTDISNPKVQARIDRCSTLVAQIEDQGGDMVFATIAVAYVESNFNPDAVGSAGERGMMQVLPQYHCVNEFSDGQGGCVNPEGASIKFLAHLLNQHGTHEALRRYNGSGAYATRVEGYISKVEAAYKG